MTLPCRVRGHFIWLIVIAYVLCNLCKTASSQVSSGRDLLEGATRTAVPLAPDSVDSEAHFWLSPHQLLFVRPAPGRPQFRVVQIDVQTGAKSLPDAFNAYASPLMPRIETMTVSYADSKLVECLDYGDCVRREEIALSAPARRGHDTLDYQDDLPNEQTKRKAPEQALSNGVTYGIGRCHTQGSLTPKPLLFDRKQRISAA